MKRYAVPKSSHNRDAITEAIRRKAHERELVKHWRTIPEAEKAKEFVAPLMEVGHSNTSTARILGITTGQVAGIRFRQKISSLNRPKIPSQSKGSGELA